LQSSLFSITEDSNASMNNYPDIYFQVKNLALGAKDIILYIKKNNFKNIFLFNGRTASSYLITKHCAENNINIFFIEYAGHANGFRLFPVPPHASKRVGELLLVYYRYGVYSLKSLKNANEYLIKEKLNSVYARNNKIPTNISYDICIFLGSDFEYTATNKDICGVVWLGNIKFCELVFKKYGLKKSYVIRCHPNSATDPNSIKLEEEFKVFLKNIGANAELISAHEKIDSHMLIKNSTLIVTDLSTISLDAIILNKPVDIFGNTDIRFIYNNQWMKDLSGKEYSRIFSEPFSLAHNLFVFRFNRLDKFFWKILFYIHRSFEKFTIWKKIEIKFLGHCNSS
jgi:hypothetical protein